MAHVKIIEHLQQLTWNMTEKIEKKKLNIPIQVLWGKKGVIGKQFKPLKIWQKYTNKKIEGYPINSGHFIPEQNPKATVTHLTDFFLDKIR